MLRTNEANLHIPIAYKFQSSREVIIEKINGAFACNYCRALLNSYLEFWKKKQEIIEW